MTTQEYQGEGDVVFVTQPRDSVSHRSLPRTPLSRVIRACASFTLRRAYIAHSNLDVWLRTAVWIAEDVGIFVSSVPSMCSQLIRSPGASLEAFREYVYTYDLRFVAYIWFMYPVFLCIDVYLFPAFVYRALFYFGWWLFREPVEGDGAFSFTLYSFAFRAFALGSGRPFLAAFIYGQWWLVWLKGIRLSPWWADVCAWPWVASSRFFDWLFELDLPPAPLEAEIRRRPRVLRLEDEDDLPPLESVSVAQKHAAAIFVGVLSRHHHSRRLLSALQSLPLDEFRDYVVTMAPNLISALHRWTDSLSHFDALYSETRAQARVLLQQQRIEAQDPRRGAPISREANLVGFDDLVVAPVLEELVKAMGRGLVGWFFGILFGLCECLWYRDFSMLHVLFHQFTMFLPLPYAILTHFVFNLLARHGGLEPASMRVLNTIVNAPTLFAAAVAEEEGVNQEQVVELLGDLGALVAAYKVLPDGADMSTYIGQIILFSRTNTGKECVSALLQCGLDLQSFLCPPGHGELQAQSATTDTAKILSHSTSSVPARIIALGAVVVSKQILGSSFDLSTLGYILGLADNALSLGDIAAAVMEVSGSIYEGIVKGDVKHIFLMRTATSWSQECAKALADSRLPYVLPVPQTIRGVEYGDTFHWERRFQGLREDYEKITGPKDKESLGSLLRAIAVRQGEMATRSAGMGTRPQPPVVVLVGEPGLGKTAFGTSLISAHLARIHPGSFATPEEGARFLASSIFRVQAGAENQYDTGFEPSKTGIFVDDIHNFPVIQGTSAFANNMLKWANTQVTMANMAEVEQKALAHIRSEIVVYTTNFANLQLGSFTVRGVGRRLTAVVTFSPNPLFLETIENQWVTGSDIFEFVPKYNGEFVTLTDEDELAAAGLPVVFAHKNRVLHTIEKDVSDPPPNTAVLIFKGRTKVTETPSMVKALAVTSLMCKNRWDTSKKAHARDGRAVCPHGLASDDGVCRCASFEEEAKKIILEAQFMSFGWFECLVLAWFGYGCWWLYHSVRTRIMEKLNTMLVRIAVKAIRDPALMESFLDVASSALPQLAGPVVDTIDESFDLWRARVQHRAELRIEILKMGLMRAWSKYKHLFLLAGAGVSLLVYNQVKTKPTIKAQGGVVSLAPVEQVNDKKRADFWLSKKTAGKGVQYHHELPLYSLVSRHGSTTTIDDYLAMVRQNVKVMRTLSGVSLALKLDATTYLANRHSVCFRGVIPSGELVHLSDSPLLTSLKGSLRVGPSTVTLSPDKDLVRLQCTSGLVGSGVRGLFWKEAIPFRAVQGYLPDGRTGIVEFGDYSPIIMSSGEPVAKATPLIRGFGLGGVEGDCGKPLIVVFNGNKWIVGIHIASEAGDGLFLPVTQRELGDAVASPPVVSPAAELRVTQLEAQFEPHIRGSSLYGQHPTSTGFIASVPKGGTDAVKVEKTAAYPFTPNGDLFGPHYMGLGEVRDGVFESPGLRKFKNLATPGAPREDVLRLAVADYLSEAPPGAAVPLDFESSFRGLGGVPFGPFKGSTASGAVYAAVGKGKKRSLFTQQGPLDVDDMFMELYKETLDDLKRGPVWISTQWRFKNEVRPLTKRYKTRVFSVVSAEFNLLLRQYFLPLIDYFMTNQVWSEMMVGVNATSPEWNDMVQALRKYEDLLLGDFEQFDSSHSWIFDAVATICEAVAKLLGYSEEDQVIVRNLVLSCPLQLVEFLNQVFLLNTGLASGLSITTLVNCLALSVLMRMVWFCSTKEPFRKHVVARFYGDDSSMTVAPKFKAVFNQRVIAETVADWGYRYTSAFKDGSLPEFEPFERFQFLKRGARYHPKLGMYVAPLDTLSFSKALAWRVKEGTVTDLERLCQVLPVLWREAWLHEDEVRDTWWKVLTEVNSTLHLGVVFPSEDVMLQSYVSNDFIGWYD